MIGTISIKCNAAHPEIALPTIYTHANSPSSIRIIDVPKKIGNWQITSVYVNVIYPDGVALNKQCVLTGGAWVATIEGNDTVGETKNGFTILANGTDELGNDVSGYVLGVGGVKVIQSNPSVEPEEQYTLMRLYEQEPTELKDGATYIDDGHLAVYADGDVVKCANESDITAIQEQLNEKADESELANYVPLSGNVVIGGDLEFASDKSIILPMDYESDIPQFTYSLYGGNGSQGRYYHWLLKPGRTGGFTQTIANMSDVEDSLIPKLDAEEYTPTRIIPLGLYYDNDPSTVVYTDLILENDGEFSEGRNRYKVEFEGDGVYVECSYARQTRRTLVENLTTGESTDTVNRSIWFGIGDVGEIADGDGDTENICVVANVPEILPTIKLTVGQSIENRLVNYYTKAEVDAIIQKLKDDNNLV